MHRLKNMKETLIGCVQTQLADIRNTDTKELGEAIDMIKDLEEAMYYCSITKAMEEAEEEKKIMEKMRKENPQEYRRHYSEMPYYLMDPYYPYERDMDKHMGRMYYSERQPRNSQGEFTSRNYYSEGGNNSSEGRRSGTSYYHEREFPLEMRDSREGRSPMSRRMYMESKELHKDKNHKVKELEKYLQELSEDIVEMIEGASPEERQILEKKMTNLTSKIAQLNANA